MASMQSKVPAHAKAKMKAVKVTNGTTPAMERVKAESKAAKTPAPKTDKTSTNGAAKKDGLRKPQIKVLEVLNKTGRSLTSKEIAEKGQIDRASLSGYIGALDDARRSNDDKNRFVSLLTLKFVRCAPPESDDDKATRFEITALGKKALEKATKA